MKHLIFLTLTAVISAGIVSSCRKGEDDPFLSLRSRKARIEGSWEFTNVSSSELTISSTSIVKKNVLFDSGTETTTTTTTSGSTTTTTKAVKTYTQKISFTKDGTYKMTYTDTGGTSTSQGTWFFLGKSKENDLKNKEAIALTQTTSSAGSSTSVFTGLNGSVFVISQLKNKEMVLTTGNSSSSSEGSYSFESTIVLTQK